MAIWDRIMNAFAGARAGWLNADTLRDGGGLGDFDTYCRWEPRKYRYDLFWAFFQNNTFQAMSHHWSPSLKAQFGLYKHTRNVFCPGKRLGDFWASYVYCGELDPDAGDGRSECGAIPIEGASPDTRSSIARLWRDSRWQVHLPNWTRTGAITGDPCLKLVDDPVRGRVTMRPIHPGHVKWLDKDDAGRVRSYILEEKRYDPRRLPIGQISPVIDPRDLEVTVTYNEECFLDGDELVYRTYLNGAPFNWRQYSGDGEEGAAEWRVPYSVVPLVMHAHSEVGLDFGMSEFLPFVSKVFEVDDLASGLGDQVRKTIRAPWVIFGAKQADFARPAYAPVTDPKDPRWGKADAWQLDRQELNIQTITDPAGKAQSLVAELPIQEVGLHIERINAEIERDYPELQMDIWASADVSGRALREARKRVVTKVRGTRPGYDFALAEAQKIATYMASVRGYEGCVRGVESPDDPRVAHSIGRRPVFEADPLDDIEEDLMFWQAAGAASLAGIPVRFYLAENGWDEKKLAELDAAKADAAAQALALAPPPTTPGLPPPPDAPGTTKPRPAANPNAGTNHPLAGTSS